MLTPALLMGSALSAAVSAPELPPIPPDLLNVAAVSYVRVKESGKVTGAYLVHSTGEARRDTEVVRWIKQRYWAKAKAGEKRNVWFPMPIAFGNIAARPMPTSCSSRANLP